MRIRSPDAEVPTSGAWIRWIARDASTAAPTHRQVRNARVASCGTGPRADSLREDWEDVTQRVAQVLLDYLDREHDAH